MVKNTKRYKFYDMQAYKRKLKRKSFIPAEYTVKIKNGRKYALAKSPITGNMASRILPMK